MTDVSLFKDLFFAYFQQDYDYLEGIRGFFLNLISEFVSKGINYRGTMSVLCFRAVCFHEGVSACVYLCPPWNP